MTASRFSFSFRPLRANSSLARAGGGRAGRRLFLPFHPNSPPPELLAALFCPSAPIHPSPLPGGRLGGGWAAASRHPRRVASSPNQSPPPLPRPPPSFLRPFRHSCVGRNRRPPSALRAPASRRPAQPASERRRTPPTTRIAAVCAGSCLRRNDGGGGRNGGMGVAVAAMRGLSRGTGAVLARGVPPPTSPPPWKGGGMNLGVGGAKCGGRRVVPACAGMTEGGVGMTAGCRNDGGAGMADEWQDGCGSGGDAWAVEGGTGVVLVRGVPPPTSPPPWKGGGMNWGAGGAKCGGRRVVPACAGMTAGA